MKVTVTVVLLQSGACIVSHATHSVSHILTVFYVQQV